MKTKHLLTSLCLGTVLLTNCSSPDSPTVSVTFKAESHLNSEDKDESYPVLLTLYELKESTKFEKADYFSLLDKAEQSLSNELIKKSEFEIRPHEELKKEIPLQTDLKYIGIFAAFRDVTHSHWKEIIDLEKDPIDNLVFSLHDFNLNKQP